MESRSIDRITLLNITLFVEAFLLLTATFWSQFASIQLAPALGWDNRHAAYGAAAGLGIAATGVVLFWMGRVAKPLERLREIVIKQIAPIFAGLRFGDLLLIAAVSGFCEEVLFRGVMQQQFGLLPTSLIFGLFHCPSLRHLSYGLWAFCGGLFLGWLYIISGNLWAPIMAHCLSNALSLMFIRYRIKPPAPPPTAKE